MIEMNVTPLVIMIDYVNLANINIHYTRLLMTRICHFFELHGIYIVIRLQCASNNCISLVA
jgi:hypothetical protein